MNTEKLPKPPPHLKTATKKWWSQVVAEYQLDAHHLRLLQAACECWDRLQNARAVLDNLPPSSTRFLRKLSKKLGISPETYLSHLFVKETVKDKTGKSLVLLNAEDADLISEALKFYVSADCDVREMTNVEAVATWRAYSPRFIEYAVESLGMSRKLARENQYRHDRRADLIERMTNLVPAPKASARKGVACHA